MKLPDSPKTPHWLQKIQFLTDPIGYLDSNYQRYGGIFNAPILSNDKRQLLVSHPQGLQQLFTRDGKEFYAPPHEPLQFLSGDNSIVSLQGDAHRRERKILMPAFQGQRIGAYGKTICALTEQIFSRLTPGTTFHALSIAQEISLTISLNVVFGIHEEKRFEQLKQLMNELVNSFTSPLMSSVIIFPSLRKDVGAWSPWGYLRRLIEQIDQLIYAEISDRRAQHDPERTDILSLLLSATDEEGQPMSDGQLRDELITLVIAGYDTTATAMSWALYWIHSFPEVREKLLKELDNLDESPEAMTIFKLPYLTAVCHESLRIYPVFPISLIRKVKEPVELMGYDLEPGTQVYGCIYLTHHSEDLYSEPKKFNPDRFLQKQYTRYEFLPFGGGSRRCIGENLALLEMKLVVATILSNYQLALVNNQSVKPQRQGLTFIPSGGVKMVLKGKRQT